MTRREFHCVEGGAQKFWAVTVDGAALTVQFGKIGAAGQTQRKSFADTDAARAAADKLVAEKTRKGYKEVAGDPAAAAAPLPALTAPPAPARCLRLAPEDWRRARGPDRPAAPLPPTVPERPFDLEALKPLAEAVFEQRAPYHLPAALTGEEARFWLHVFSVIAHLDHDRRRIAIRNLKPGPWLKPLTLAQVKAAFEKMLYWGESLPTLRAQRAWMIPADLVEAVACHPVARLMAHDAVDMGEWLAAEVFARLDNAAMATVRDRLRALLKGAAGDVALVAAVLARYAGMDADVVAFVAGLKKGGIPARTDWAAVLFGLPDVEGLVAGFRRLGLRPGNPADARVWLARTGHAALDVLRDSILAMRKADDLLAMLDVLLLAESPEAAVALLEVKLQARPVEASSRITAWLKAHHDHAVAGLTPLTAENTPRGEAARAFLADAAAPASDADWLRTALDGVKAARSLPAWADPATLPPLHGLSATDVTRVVSALAASTLAGPHPLVAALRRHGDRPALAAFNWALFQGWLAAGAPAKEKWTLLGLGHFGDDGVAIQLAPLIRVWPGQSQHQRAVTGLEVLRAIGTDTALTQLNGMALKLKFKALQDRARSLMEAIAADRGLSREQLEDRIVPDLGLDAGGGRTFDFGPRRFRFALAGDLSPRVTDEAGKELAELPKPRASDDAAKAAEAVAAWRLLRTQLREALKVQVVRLEEAMIAGRGWSAQEFRTLLVGHPLLTHLVRRLVWQGPALFRVADGGATVGVDGAAVPLEGGASVRVAHRLRMTVGQVGSWSAVLERLGLEAPFAQLDRPVYAPDAAAAATEFVQPQGDVRGGTIRGKLEGRGWRRLMHDQGGITGFSKAYSAAGVTAVVFLQDTLLIGMMDDAANGVRAAYFVAGVGHRHGPCSDEYHEHLPRLRLGDVDAVAYSETMHDLLGLLPPGKG